ncbi:MAG: hypothetical protein ABSH32_17665 [Bryobacteraceae bacterium]
MKTDPLPKCLIWCAIVTLHFSALAQSSLKALYGEPVEAAFLVQTGVRLKAVYGSDRRACVLTTSGPISERELMRVFETAVPKSVRGIQKLSLDERMGVCRGTSQTSGPAAVIVFKRKDCEAAANEQKKVPMRSTSIGSDAANDGKAK